MTTRSRHPIQHGVELALAVPVALLGRIRRRLPGVAQHVGNSRAVGKLVVEQGIAQVTESKVPSPKGSAPAATPRPARDVSRATRVVEVPSAPSAIPDYASLAASQVVPRLAALTDSEVEEVAAYEMATRKRRTILAAVERRRP